MAEDGAAEHVNERLHEQAPPTEGRVAGGDEAVDPFATGVRLVRALATRARQAEPALTAMLGRILDDHGHGSLEGLDCRLKALDSASRKFSSLLTRGLSATQALGGLNDLVRFSVVVGDDHLAGTAVAVMAALQRRGCTNTKFANRFAAEDGYRGLNTNWRTRVGVVFEVQFHTPASYAATVCTHQLYERLRGHGLSAEVRQNLQQASDEVYAQVRVPDEVTRLDGPPVRSGRADTGRGPTRARGRAGQRDRGEGVQR